MKTTKVLHLDGDAEYLESCKDLYREFNIEVIGILVEEREQPRVVLDLVKQHKPDIVVLTGHDSMNKSISNYLDLQYYRNSVHFAEAVRILREYNSNYDDLIIFAGACQSCYELILEAGANFATAPQRVLVHCLDPVFVCEKIVRTPIDKSVPVQEVLSNTLTGSKGIGGIQTKGKYREGFPRSFYV